MKNNIDMESIEETRKKLLVGDFPERKAFVVQGEWMPEGNGQFKALLEFPTGTLEVVTDQAIPSGGKGLAPNPVDYCVFAMIACYTTTFVTLATEKGIEIRSLKARGASEVDMRVVFGIEEGPIVEKVWIELQVETSASPEELEELREEANLKCPAAFTVQRPVPFESRILH